MQNHYTRDKTKKDLGREIIHRQLFFRGELRERVYWFLKLRWLAAALGLGFVGLSHLLNWPLAYLPVLTVMLLVVAYNALFWLVGRRLDAYQYTRVKPFERFAHTQISLDLLALFTIIFFTGGPVSPFLIFVIFHIVLAGILLSPRSCYGYAFGVLVLVGLLLWLNHLGLVPASDLRFENPLLLRNLPPSFGIVPFLTFAAGIVIAAYLITTVKGALQLKGRELMSVSRQLENSNLKLTSLYEMIKEVIYCTNGRQLMDSAVRNAARIMDVKACSIKLLDQEAQCLRFAATYGLSINYLEKDCISIEESEINRGILEGSVYTIGDIGEESYFQYPENIRKEGIASMLCLPMKAGHKILGVFCVYSGKPGFFSESDADFFSLMTDLTSLAMDRLNREMVKQWFFNKAAHQLKSPINTIRSMLSVLEGGFLGRLEAQQLDTVAGCQKRLNVLQDTIADLLKLASERQEISRPEIPPVNATEILLTIKPHYQPLAKEKNIDLDFEVTKKMLMVQGEKSVLGDIFSNIISNALKYTPPKGKVVVSLTPETNGSALFEVTDTGIGISEDDQARLFGEFFRAENAKALTDEGTGLGLVLVKENLNRIGGAILIQSRLAEGTKVSCVLPLAPQ